MAYNRRYYLHLQLKKKGVNYNPFSKTIFVPFNKVDQQITHVDFLQKEYNYQVQTEIC